MAKQTAKNIEAATAADIESVEALLEDLDLGDGPVEMEAVEETAEDVIEEVTATDEVDGEIDATELRDLELHEAREEAYGEQKAIEADPAAAEEAAKAAATAKPAKKTKAAGAAVPRTPRADLATIDGSFFVLEGDPKAHDADGLEAIKKATMALMPSQKKIAEKFENLFQSLAAGKQPSVYVVQAFKLLDAKKSMTSLDLVAAFKTSYAQGTAMSQAGQIMNLFDAVKIATRTKSSLVLNDNSTVAQRIRDAITAAKGA